MGMKDCLLAVAILAAQAVAAEKVTDETDIENTAGSGLGFLWVAIPLALAAGACISQK